MFGHDSGEAISCLDYKIMEHNTERKYISMYVCLYISIRLSHRVFPVSLPLECNTYELLISYRHELVTQHAASRLTCKLTLKYIIIANSVHLVY